MLTSNSDFLTCSIKPIDADIADLHERPADSDQDPGKWGVREGVWLHFSNINIVIKFQSIIDLFTLSDYCFLDVV